MSIPVIVIKGYQQENGLVYVKLNHGTYRIDGEKIIEVTNYNPEEVIIDEGSTIEKVSVNKYISSYKNVEDDSKIISSSEYLKTKQLLQENGAEPTDDGELLWNTIKDRHTYELFLSQWKPEYITEMLYDKVLVSIEGNAPLDHQYIKPIRKITGDLTNTLYRYSQANHAATKLRELLIQNGYQALKQEPTSFGTPKDCDNTFFIKDNVKFSKIFTKTSTANKNEFITIVMPALKDFEKDSSISGTFKEIEAKYLINEIIIKEAVSSYLNSNRSIAELGPTIDQLLNDLNTLSNMLRGVEPMKKSHRDHQDACSKLNKILKILSTTVANLGN